MNRIHTILALSFTVVASTGCRGAKAEERHTAPAPVVVDNATLPAPTPAPAPQAEEKQTIELTIGTVGDTMAFDKTKLTVPAGSKVHLVLKTHGKLAVMQHNWVLVKSGTEAHVALEGLEKAPKSGYVVPSDEVLAYTPLAGPGVDTEVTFDAPPPGTYPYICTFPGHYVVMKGELTVTP